MKTKITTITCIALMSVTAMAQDIITYKNGTEAKVKVAEVTGSEVKFKNYDNPSGPTYTMAKSDIFMIKYENGTKEVYAENAPSTTSTNYSNQKKDYVRDDRVRYNGPRLGMTFVGAGMIQDQMKNQGLSNYFSQFGWQFETRFFTLDNGFSGLLEFVPMIGGLEQGRFLPSASLLIGGRTKKGHEFGVGPNLSQSGWGLVLAVGSSYKVGNVCFPINLAIVPSVTKMGTSYVYDPSNPYGGTYVTTKYQTGVRVSLLVGFNSRKN